MVLILITKKNSMNKERKTQSGKHQYIAPDCFATEILIEQNIFSSGSADDFGYGGE
mgnify:CR=1 FL=1